MMPAMCVPWPFASPSLTRTRAPVKSRLSEHAAAQVRMPRVDAGVDDRHADAAAGEAAHPLDRACPHLVGANRLGRDVAIVRTGTSPDTLDTSASSLRSRSCPPVTSRTAAVAQPLLDARAVARRQDLDLLVARASR